jgi:hypothetical protein
MAEEPSDYDTARLDLVQPALDRPAVPKKKRKPVVVPKPPVAKLPEPMADQPKKEAAAPAKPSPAGATEPATAPPGEGARARPPTIAGRPAAEVAALFPLSEEARKLLQDNLTVLTYLYALMKNHFYLDAVRLLAHALPKREAVWWACLCARSVSGDNPPSPVAVALEAAEKWVVDPSEENRRPALAAAAAAEFSTPAGCAALAAFWSSGSLAPPGVPVIPPGETLTAQGAANAVLLAAVATEPEKAPDRYVRFLTEGVRVANGASKWA